jgi:hypothetical protein
MLGIDSDVLSQTNHSIAKYDHTRLQRNQQIITSGIIDLQKVIAGEILKIQVILSKNREGKLKVQDKGK